MEVDAVVEGFKRLPIKGGYVVELELEPGRELSLRIEQDASNLRPGACHETYSLRFACLRDVSTSLVLPRAATRIASYQAKATTDRQLQKYSARGIVYSPKTWCFSLEMSDGNIQIEAESFSFGVVSRSEIRGPESAITSGIAQ